MDSLKFNKSIFIARLKFSEYGGIAGGHLGYPHVTLFEPLG